MSLISNDLERDDKSDYQTLKRSSVSPGKSDISISRYDNSPRTLEQI